MPEILVHRQNRVQDLEALDPAYGAEIDVRSHNGALILAHDPLVPGDSLETYLARFAKNHSERLLIINTKEDGHELNILTLLSKYAIQRFFFLDTTLPTLVQLTVKSKEKRVAVRVSEYEPVEAAQRFAGLADWIWLDCFSGVAPTLNTVRLLQKSFKVCLVSPELQGYPADQISSFLQLKPVIDAVCTKVPEHWR
jgi:hypothetical protein